MVIKSLIGSLTGLKVTYFVLFIGYGATLPYMALYFRQIGLNASYVGAIAGIRPMVQFISCPFWAIISDKFNIRRIILNISILAWLLFTVVLYIPRPINHYCSWDLKNGSKNIEKIENKPETYYEGNLTTRPSDMDYQTKRSKTETRLNTFQFRNLEHKHVSPRHHVAKDVPRSQRRKEDEIPKYINQTCEENPKSFHKPISAVFVDENSCVPLVYYETKQVYTVFIIIFTLTAVGEFFEAPSVSLLDTAILENLDGQMKDYGKVRLYGSLGFGLASFFVGLVLDHLHVEICGKLVTNFMITLYVFIIAMLMALLTSVVCVRFKNDREERVQETSPTTTSETKKYCDICSGESRLENEKKKGLREILEIFKQPRYFLYLVVSLFMGFSHGSIMNFINWYLDDLGASRLMMGSATVIRDFSVVLGFYISPGILELYTEMKVVVWTFFVYIFSYFSYSIITSPWYAVPVECVQGFAYAVMWSSCITFFGNAVSKENSTTMQGNTQENSLIVYFNIGIIQGIYWGLGTGTGAVVGGLSINRFGCAKSFELGGYTTCIVLVIFIVLYYFLVKYENGGEKKQKLKSNGDHFSNESIRRDDKKNPIFSENDKMISSKELNESETGNIEYLHFIQKLNNEVDEKKSPEKEFIRCCRSDSFYKYTNRGLHDKNYHFNEKAHSQDIYHLNDDDDDDNKTMPKKGLIGNSSENINNLNSKNLCEDRIEFSNYKLNNENKNVNFYKTQNKVKISVKSMEEKVFKGGIKRGKLEENDSKSHKFYLIIDQNQPEKQLKINNNLIESTKLINSENLKSEYCDNKITKNSNESYIPARKCENHSEVNHMDEENILRKCTHFSDPRLVNKSSIISDNLYIDVTNNNSTTDFKNDVKPSVDIYEHEKPNKKCSYCLKSADQCVFKQKLLLSTTLNENKINLPHEPIIKKQRRDDYKEKKSHTKRK